MATSLTEASDLAGTEWELIEIRSPDGTVHLPFAGGPRTERDCVPGVSYDDRGRFDVMSDGDTAWSRMAGSDDIEAGLIERIGARLAFPDVPELVYVLSRGEPTVDGSALTLVWNGFVASPVLK